MNPTHAIPTLTALSASQKRALILRDHLRYLAPHHLDSFLAGISSPEPPPYRVVKGVIYPPLAHVTLQPQAMRFELGNVSFPGGVVLRAALVCVDERVEMRKEEDGVKLEEDGDGGVPIHVFLAEKMAELFWDKVEKVRERCAEVNRARKEMWDKAKRAQREAQTQAQTQISRRREPSVSTTANERPHKRPRTSTPSSSIKQSSVSAPTSTKQSSTSAPTSITAPPSRTSASADASCASPALSNLLTASQTLISVYSNPSSEFADLHRAVVKLKDAVDGASTPAGPLASGSGARQPAAKDASADEDADAYASSIARTNRHSATEAQARGKRTDRPAPSRDALFSATGSFCEGPEIAREPECNASRGERERSRGDADETAMTPTQMQTRAGVMGQELELDHGHGGSRRDASGREPQLERTNAEAHACGQGQGLGLEGPALTGAAADVDADAGGGCVAPVARMVPANRGDGAE